MKQTNINDHDMSAIEWPPNFERTPASERTRNNSFEASLATTTKDIEVELDRLDVDDWKASIGNQHTKSNGLPLHNANPDDPGFVLRWSKDGDQFAVACDAYSRLRDNCRAVYLWVHETRMRSQRPVVTGQSEFSAAKLPPGDEEREKVVGRQPPHEVLGVAPDAPEEVVEAAARRLKAKHHPDSGGDEDAFKRVTRAENRMLSE